ncbi:MAG: putative DNA binding domain-containing protein [Methanomassiliicoccaceae archaeon]|nr:putative DNA binding domain-containing protein [Methanomassiliicoccaceae archaeon]
MGIMKNMVTLEEEISAGEGKRLELKEKFSDDHHSFLKTAVAFANTSSGKIVIGVREDRKVTGVPDGEIFGLMDSIADCINAGCHPQLMPNIFLTTIKGKSVIVIEINESGARPYHLKSEGVLKGTYVRIGATSVLASAEVINDLRMSGKNRSFDEQICSDFEATDDRISEVCAILGKHSERKFTKVDLLNMRLLVQSGNEIHATNAFALMCGENPLCHASIRCGLFKKDRSIVLDRKEYDGSIIKQVENAQNFVLSNIHVGMELNGLYRKDVFEIPKDALREALLNLAVHRNYTLHESASFVSVYDDKVEILSPGMLPWGTDMEK